MLDDRKTTQASRYVLGALSIDEQREFEAALQEDEKLQLLVKELRGTSRPTSATMPSTGVPGESPLPLVPKSRDPSAPPKTPGWILWSPWLLSVALGGVCLALLSSAGNIRQRVVALAEILQQKDRELAEMKRQNAVLATTTEGFTNIQRRVRELEGQFVRGVEKLGQQAVLTNQLVQQLAEARSEIASARSNEIRLTHANQTLEAAVAALGARETNRIASARLISLRPGAAGAGSSGALYWSVVDQRGVLTTDQLPDLLPIQSFQLWLVSGTNRPVSAGLLPRNPSGRVIQFAPARPVEDFRRAFVTIESAFGSAAPGNQVVLDSK